MAEVLMTAAEYKMTLDRLGLMARLVLDMDIERFLEQIRLAEILGPLIDPTLYIAMRSNPLARADFEATKEIARALLKVQEVSKGLKVAFLG